MFETGPRSLLARPSALYALSLLHELGLRQHCVPANAAAKVRMIYKDGRIQRLPTGPVSALLSPLARPALAGLVRNWWHGRAADQAVRPGIDPAAVPAADDISVGDFITSRVNAHTAENLVDPLVAGIWAGCVDKLSIWSTFPMMAPAEARASNRSFVRGLMSSDSPASSAKPNPFDGLQRPPIDPEHARLAMSDSLLGSSFTLTRGLQMFTEAIRAGLARRDNVRFRMDTAVTALRCDNGGDGAAGVRVTLGNNATEAQQAFDKVFWTTDAPALHAAAVPSAPASAPLARATSASASASPLDALTAFEYANVVIVHIAFPTNVLPREFAGFGFLVPSSEHARPGLADEQRLALDGLLGVAFDSVAFPSQNVTREQFQHMVATSPASSPTPSSSSAAPPSASSSSAQSLSPSSDSAAAPDQLRLTVMMGGARFPHIARLAPAEWELRARAVVRHLLGIEQAPDMLHAHCARTGIPQPNVGHSQRLGEARAALKEWSGGRVELAGMVAGVSVPDCVSTAARLAVEYARESLTAGDTDATAIETKSGAQTPAL